LRITAAGHEPYQEPLDLSSDALDVTLAIHLHP